MTTPRGRPEAILRPHLAERAFDVQRIAPQPALAPFVDYHWLVRWHVEAPFRQQVLPQPRVHLVAEEGRLLVHGVTRQPFARLLHGTGHVLGTAFHPGGFRPLLGCAVSAVSGAVTPAGTVLGRDDRPTAQLIAADGDPTDLVAAMETYLLTPPPTPDPVVADVTRWVALAERHRDITRADQLAERAGVSLRTLQRLFSAYVGIGPKWVIQRCRILEAAAAAHDGGPTDWAALAGALGFSDQSHLTRAFTAVVGQPPAAYQREATGDR